MIEWLSTYNPAIGMPPISVITSIFGAFAVSFTLVICWSRLVRDFGPIGGFLCAIVLIGSFWLLNHKLPGFGIHPECLPAPDGGSKQFGLIYQAFKGACPWVDMGTAIAFGTWFNSFLDSPRGTKCARVRECLPRLAVVMLGGAVGGGIVGLIGWTGANLFGY